MATWVRSPKELLWLAPSTEGPLTAAKVTAWRSPRGHARVFARVSDDAPIGYGELNPMRREARHLWLGHMIVRPDHRGQGTGRTFVRALVDYAFDTLATVKLSLVVFPDNTAALACYRHAGFVIAGEESHHFVSAGPKYRLLRLEFPTPKENAARPRTITP